MFDIRKPKQKAGVPIRPASKIELANFEKHKTSSAEQAVADNGIETICINGDKLQVNPVNKEVHIDLGNLAFKNKISPTELATDEYFIINCEIDEKDLK